MGVALNLYGGATPSGVIGVNITAESSIAKGYFGKFRKIAYLELEDEKITTTIRKKILFLIWTATV